MARAPQDIPESTLRLMLVPGIGPATMRKLTERFGDHDRIIAATVSELIELDGIGRESAVTLRRGMDEANTDEERSAMIDRGAELIVMGDEDYPPLLAAIPDPPPALWVRGSLAPSDRLAVAIVGSRRCTAYGREQASRFASLLAQSGLTIVSGGAIGVDGEAHRGALRVNGRTIAVLGCGLGECYPPQHDELFEHIVRSGRESRGESEFGGGGHSGGGGGGGGGALVSEYPMATPPKATHFPSRNRIISGLSLGVLVIEAAHQSGALITARVAGEQHGREVMAVPGRVDSPASAGCLKAIREGWAALVLDHADVLNQLDASSQLVRGALESAGHPDAASTATLFDDALTDCQRAIVQALTDEGGALVVDQIAARTQRPLTQILSDLTLLQIRGRVHKDHRGVSIRS